MSTIDEPDREMTVQQAATELGVSKSRVNQYIADGRLPVARKLGTLRVVRLRDVVTLRGLIRPEGWQPGRPRAKD
jgi:excisionase family DNA binding protein